LKVYTLNLKLKFLENFIIKCVKKLNKAAPRFEAGARFETCCYNWLILCGLPDSPTTHLPEKYLINFVSTGFCFFGRWNFNENKI